MPQIVQRPVRTEQVVAASQDGAHGLVRQRTGLAPQREPNRLIRAGDASFELIEPKPYESIRRRGQPLQLATFAVNADQLVTHVDPVTREPEQLARPRTAADIKRHQRPVPVGPQTAKQIVELPIRD